MTDVPAADTAAELKSGAPPAVSSAGWPWVFLALWAGWLAFLIVLSWPELGRPRTAHEQTTESPPRISQP